MPLITHTTLPAITTKNIFRASGNAQTIHNIKAEFEGMIDHFSFVIQHTRFINNVT